MLHINLYANAIENYFKNIPLRRLNAMNGEKKENLFHCRLHNENSLNAYADEFFGALKITFGALFFCVSASTLLFCSAKWLVLLFNFPLPLLL